MIRLLSTLLLTCLTAIPAFAGTAHIVADRDANLIEPAVYDEYPEKGCPTKPEDVCANGSGPYFFAGHTNQEDFGIRRGLVRFDVAAAVPENALIDSAALNLYQTSENITPSAVSLHRVMSDWGEGASFATGGSGAAAEVGDATWLHTFYDYDYWVQQGGHVVPHASATEMVSGNNFYTWEDSVHLVNDVRLWLHAPQQNYGWLVMGDEATRGSVKRFYSRECTNDNIVVRHQCDDSSKRPMLTIEYHLPGE